MTVILFIVILVVLIVGHEFGHFIVAKLSGMKVPEFGLGFPPKLWGKKMGDTEYTLNALPFGGFVKIVGEDVSEETSLDPAAFSNRPKYLQALTLLAGPGANLLIAFLLTSTAFVIGIPAATDSGYEASRIHNASVTIVEVVAGSPAEKAGLKPGDRVISVASDGATLSVETPEQISDFIQHAGASVTMSLLREGKSVFVSVSPQKGIVPQEPNEKAVGIATAAVGMLQLPLGEALKAGFTETIQNIKSVFVGIVSLIGRAVTLTANFSNVAGPVGIATLVGDAATFGLGSVLAFAALISINLGVINLFPFPALDGGRLALVLIEGISGRRMPAKVANAINSIGFALLVLLMVAITVHDISRLMA